MTHLHFLLHISLPLKWLDWIQGYCFPSPPSPSRTFKCYFPLFLDIVMSLKQKTIKLNQDQNSNITNWVLNSLQIVVVTQCLLLLCFLRDLTGARELIEFLMMISANWIRDIREFSPVTWQRYCIIMLMGAEVTMMTVTNISLTEYHWICKSF